MARSCIPETPPLGPASSTSSFSSAQPTLSSNSSMPRLAARKSVPTLPSEPVDVSSQSAESSGQLFTITPPYSLRQRSNTSGSSPGSLEKRTVSSPTSPPPPTGLTPRSLPLTPAGQSAASPATTIWSPSLSRNSSVPASLAHTVPSSNIPTRSRSASAARPSLSFPSPPTPVVPSIPLRHATQHSTTQSTNITSSSTAPSAPNTPPSAPASHSRESIDPQPSSKRHLNEPTPGITPLTTASDPNLPPPRPSGPSSPSESTHWALTLKHLLAKPAVPVNLVSSSESESGVVASLSPTSPSRHRRSASTIDHPQRATDLNMESSCTTGLGVLDVFRARQTQATSFKDAPDSRAHYHGSTDRRHMSGSVSQSWTQNKDQGEWIPGHSIFWPEWTSGNEKRMERKPTKGKEKVKNGEREKEKDSRTRNVLRRRPSANSRVSGPRPRGSTSPTLSRATSMTSLVKRGVLATPAPARPSTAHGASTLPNKHATLYQSPPASPSGPRPPVVHDKSNDQGAHRSRASTTRSSTAPGPGASVSRDAPSPSSTSSSIAARVSTQGPSSSTAAALAALGPAHFYKVRDSAGMQSTASSASSTSRRGYSKDRALSPAGAVADAYKREQLAKEFPPSGPYRPPSPDPPSIVIDTGDIRGARDTTNRNASNKPESKNSSRSDLSYAEPGSAARSTGVVGQVLSVPREYAKLYQDTSSPETLESAAHDSPKGYRYALDPKLSPVSSPHPPPPPDPSPPLTSPPPRTSSSKEHPRHRSKAIQHNRNEGDDASSHTPYYTVFGGPTDQVVAVGGPRDSYGANYSPMDQSLWGVQTTVTVGKTTEAERERISLRRSLSRKLSGKFKRDRSAGAAEEGLSGQRGRSGWQDGQGLPTSPQTSLLKMGSEKEEERDLSPILSPTKHSPNEKGAGTKEKSGRMFKFWRFKTGSKEKNEGIKVEEDPPPLPTLPKYYHPRNASQPSDIYTPINSRRDHSRDPSPFKKSPRTPNSNARTTSSRSARPSTAPSTPMSFDAASKFWNRTQSARSSFSSCDDRLVPSPRRVLAKIASAEDTDIRKFKPGTFTRKPSNAPRKAHTDIEGEPYKLMTDAGRSDSPPIPSFSNTDVINSFPPRRSSDRSKNSPTSPSSLAGATPPVLSPAPASSPVSLPTSLPAPPRPQRSSRRPKPASRSTSPNDEPLYPPVMKKAASAIPRLTFREMYPPKRTVLTEQEKADRWDALLERSEAAGGTLHFGGDDDKLPSDELRFSRTLSELARDDD